MNIPRINVAFGFDHSFYIPAYVTITSLLHSAANKCCYDIYILQNTLSQAEKDKIVSLVSSFSSNSSITFLDHDDRFENAVRNPFLSPAAYSRLLLHELLPHIDKILWLDSDLIVLNHLCELYNQNMGDNLLMGVLDIANISIQWRIHCARCAVPLKRMEYINSGVLLMNLKELRIANLKDIWLKLAFTQKLPYLDQSILNYTCEGRIGFLPLKFNYNDLWKTQLTITLKEGLFSQEEFNEANKNPVIYHYWGKFKPWREHEMSSADIWWKYAKMTAIL